MKMSSGSIEIITGSTQSGKTTEAFRRLNIDAAVGRKCIYINHIQDSRSTEPFSTNNPFYNGIQMTFIKDIAKIKCSQLPDLEELNEYNTVVIDEAQFFDDLSIVVDYAETLNIRVIVSGLIADSSRKKFGNILELTRKANKFDLLEAVCMQCVKDGNPKNVPAFFSHRLCKNNDQVCVGGSDKYMPVCRYHYIYLNK